MSRPKSKKARSLLRPVFSGVLMRSVAAVAGSVRACQERSVLSVGQSITERCYTSCPSMSSRVGVHRSAAVRARRKIFVPGGLQSSSGMTCRWRYQVVKPLALPSSVSRAGAGVACVRSSRL